MVANYTDNQPKCQYLSLTPEAFMTPEAFTEGEVTITRRGEAIARMVQVGRKRPIPSHRDLREKMARMRIGSEKLVRQDRDAR